MPEPVADPGLQERVDAILSSQSTRVGQLIELAVGILILVVCGLFVAESMPIDSQTYGILVGIETSITIVFLIEYVARLWAKRFSLRFMFSRLAIIDLLAVLPLLFPASHLQFVRVLRLIRILRLARLLQNEKFFFGEVTATHLAVLRILLTVFSLVFITGGLLYDIESPVNDAFTTMLDGVYFAVVTLTTVGFGDITPQTEAGRVVTMVMILAGVMVIPWQLTNLVRRIVLESNKRAAVCTSCGLQYHDPDASHCKACGSLIYQEYDGA
jgi:voltage-gated potassium channel